MFCRSEVLIRPISSGVLTTCMFPRTDSAVNLANKCIMPRKVNLVNQCFLCCSVTGSIFLFMFS